jgi:signal transduction histidine kinase
MAMAWGSQRSPWAAVSNGAKSTGLWKFEADAWKRVSATGFDGRRLNIKKLLDDKLGSIWIGTLGQGLVRFANGRTDHFDHLDGLADDTVLDLTEGRESSVWVITPQSVEQFFDLPIVRFTKRDGLSDDSVEYLAPDPFGGIYVASGSSIDHISEADKISRFKKEPGGSRGGIVFAARAGGVWSGSDSQLLMYDRRSGRKPVNELDEAVSGVEGLAEDTHHDVWASIQFPTVTRSRLWRFHQGRVVERLAPTGMGGHTIDQIASDLAGGLWVPVIHNALYHLGGHTFERVNNIGAEAGKFIPQVLPIAPGEAWVTTSKGAVWLKDGHTRVLDATNGLPCDSVYGVALDRFGDLWLATQCALVEVPKSDLARWRLQPKYVPRVVTFGHAYGYFGDVDSRIWRSNDGRLWFAGGDELYEIDPTRIFANSLAPPLQIQGLEADQRPYPATPRTVLPKLTRNLEIDYAALSYVQPDLLKFRYRLIGHDRDWIDVGSRRQAFYTDLPPGTYRFQVTACNENGVCNDKGASTTIVVPPAWWQTWWFRALCVLTVLALAVAAARWRLNAYAEQMRMRFDDRLQERTRVARDLHDTLMQTVLASKMLADNASTLDTGSDGQAAFARLSNWLGRAAEEGRAAVNALRTSSNEADDLIEAFELAALEGCTGRDIEAPITLVGEAHQLHPMVRDEVYRIGVESIRNACIHSGASHILIALEYSQNLVLHVSDDGRGIPEAVLQAGKTGHFGLVGMRERAEHIGAKLTVSSSSLGTEITLFVPGRVAFAGKPGLLPGLGRLWSRRFKSQSQALQPDEL